MLLAARGGLPDVTLIIEADITIDEHPMMSGKVTAPERSPVTAGCAICIGRKWRRANLEHAVRRLEHRGPAWWILRTRHVSFVSFAETPRATDLGTSRVWTMGLDREEHEAAVDLARRGELFDRGPLRLHFGTVLHYVPATRGLEISRGELHAPSMHFAQQGGNLLIAPELKAFSDIESVEDIREIPRGHAFRFDPERQRVELELRAHYWPPVEPTAASYEACQAEMRRLLAEGMDRALGQCETEPVLALSGGLDSAVVGYLAREAGRRPAAFTVYFDPGGGSASPDLEGARQTAKALGLDLTELRIGMEDLDPLTRQVQWLTEERGWRDIETGVFVLRLARELQARNIRTVLMGSKADNLFVAHAEPMIYREGFEAYRDYITRSYMPTGMQTMVTSLLGQKVVSPFVYEPLIQFARRLPQAYLIDESEAIPRGKKILRDTYGPLFESSIVHGAKRYPLDTMGFAEMFRQRFGERPRRQARYDRLRRKMFRPRRARRPWHWPWGAGMRDWRET